jgi:hypothetical protein
VECPVGPVFVVEGFILAKRVQKMGLVDDQGPVEEFGSARAHPPLHDCVHPRHSDSGLDDGDALAAKTASKAAV